MTLGGRRVILVPLYHPAAALYTPTMLEVLERDVARLGAILGRDGEACVDSTQARIAESLRAPVVVGAGDRRPVQLGLF